MRTTPRLSDTPNPSGSWEIRWSEMEANGTWRSHRKSTKTSDRQLAEAVLTKFLVDLQQGSPLVRLSVDDIVAGYLRHHSDPRGNLYTDERALRAPLLAFGTRDPRSIAEDDIEDFTKRRLRGELGRLTASGQRKKVPVSPATVQREIAALQAALNWGSRKLMIPGRPTFRFGKPAGGSVRQLWLTEAQEREVLAALPSASRSLQFYVMAGLAYGVRSGAMMQLRFGDQVSFITGTVDFNVPGARVTRKRRPAPPMTPEIRQVLEVLFQERGPEALVLDRDTPDRFAEFMTSIGYGWVTAHVMKHTAISLMLRGGAKPEDVAKVTATDIKTIMRVYRHHTADEMLNTIGSRRA